MSQKIKKKFLFTVIICLLWGLIATDSLWMILLLLCGVAFFKKKKIRIILQPVDLCLLIVGITEAVLYFQSTYPANSVHFPLICLTFILLWFIMRLWIVEDNQKQLIFSILTATGGILAIITIFFFISFMVKVNDMGFGDTTQFRYLYRPMWMLSNDWASIMLAFLPFTIASFFSLPKPYYRIAALVCVLISLSVIVSFSRGAIFCLIFLYILTIALLLYYKMYPLKRIVLGCCIWFAVIAIFCIPVRSPLLTTLAVTKNTSQVRSIEGRFNKWKDAVELFSQYPVTGVGAGNFSLKAEPISNQRESIFTGRSTNSLLQLAAEKGLVGLSAYGLFFAVWLIAMFRTLRQRKNQHFTAMICGAGIIVCLLLREATFSTIFVKPSLLLLIILSFWFSVSCLSGLRTIKMHWIFLLLIPVIYFGVLQTRQKEVIIQNRAFVRAYEKGEDGWDKLEKSLILSSDNAVLFANKGFYLLSQISGYDSLIFLNANTTDSILFQAKDAFEKAVKLSPSDASFKSNLGILQLATGDTVSALRNFTQSLSLAPHQSIYHILCGMAFPDDRRQRFVHAVYYSPEMLDSKWFFNLKEQDSLFAASVVSDAQTMLSDHRDDPLLKARLAKVLLYQGKTDIAETLLSEVTVNMPNLNRPWLMLGDIASNRNDTIALQYYKRAVQLYPTDAWANKRIGDWYYNNGDSENAIDYYIAALRATYLAPTEHSGRSYSMYSSTRTVTNDVIPPAFYRSIKPFIDIRQLADIISQRYAQEGNTQEAALYRQIANGEIGIRKAIYP